MMTCVWRTNALCFYNVRAPLSLASSVKCSAFCSCRYPTAVAVVLLLLLLLPISITITFGHLFILITHAIHRENTPKESEMKRVHSNQLFIVRRAIGIVCNCMYKQREFEWEPNQRSFGDSRARANSLGPVSCCVPSHKQTKSTITTATKTK